MYFNRHNERFFLFPNDTMGHIWAFSCTVSLRLQRWNILFLMNEEKFMSDIHLQQHNFCCIHYSYLDCPGYLESEVDSFSTGSSSQTAKKK